jgi:hypothetical protein
VPHKQYVIGARCASSEADWPVGFVIEQRRGEQVAMLRERVQPALFAEHLEMLARFYNWAYLIPEANNADFVKALLRTGYRYERIFSQRRTPGAAVDGAPEIGFETTDVTRQWLVSAI